MINLTRLNHIIDYGGIKHTVLAMKLGISRTTLWSRLTGLSEFTPKELDDIFEVLRLNDEEKRKLYDLGPQKVCMAEGSKTRNRTNKN